MDRARDPFDLVVVGAGIIGTLVALLAKRHHPGWRIALVDRSLAGHGATLYSAFLDVPLGATPVRRALTERSRVLYQQLRAELPDLPLRDLPAVFLTSEARVQERLDGLVRDATSAPRRVDAAAALALAPPGFRSPEGTAVLGEVRAARCTGPTLVTTLLRAFLARPGSVCLEGVEVVRVSAEGDGAQRLTAHDGREWVAHRTALCLGPWLGSTRAALADVPRHWRVKKITALHVPVAPHPDAPVVYLLDDEAFLLPQPEHGRFLFSFRSEHWDCEPEASALRIDPPDWTRARNILERYLDVRGLELGGRVFCDAYSADTDPSVEPLAAVPGAFAVGGGAGSGFRLAPALAERAVHALEAAGTGR
ncbi:FAD-binding oxidoreductase [Corallococcus exercitus]|uniref:FAD-binding oxidoreductase n=1 Tax=Corallococcus exercitus TaxID=2316736 RepID=A0A7Y4KDW2_9BACT|nr:FAD-binding oxidoreductase [Corallococcus exercitus]NOK32043.1 FAD-binding oxidoreductase [Corallococcus exercitus]